MSVKFEGATYDLTEFSHPGGSVIHAAYNTDVTATIHSYHPDVERVRRAIEQYKVASDDDDKTKESYKGPLYGELKRRVHSAIKEKLHTTTGADVALRMKMVVAVMSYVLSFLWLAVSENHSNSTLLAACSLGISAAMVGMDVMHDASHMAIERGPRVWWNYVWQLSGDIMGVSALGWRHLHVIDHHINTDNRGDPDVTYLYPLIRSLQDQQHLPNHYLQSLLLIPLSHTLNVIYQIVDVIHPLNNVHMWEGVGKPVRLQHTKLEWAQFAFAKLCLVGTWVFLWHKGGLQAWALNCVCGSVLFATFDAPGHQTTHPNLPSFDKLPSSMQQGDVIDTWLLEQLHKTNTFAPHLNGFAGGLNMQIEHHLFPRVSHRHYPYMRPIIQEFCREHGLPYNDYSFFGVLYATVERLVILSFPPKSKVV